MTSTLAAPTPVAPDEVRADQKSAGLSTFYYPQLDGMRSLAFLMVFGSHAGGFAEANFPPVLKQMATVYNDVVRVGWSGVDLFFVLSAFLITSLLLREEQAFNKISVGKFLFRRVLRIWPLYFLVVFVGMMTYPFVTDPVGPRFGSHSFYLYVGNNMFWFYTFTMNLGMSYLLSCPPANLTPLWSISLEEQFYLFWGFFLKGVRGFGWRAAILTLLLIGTIAYRSHLMHHSGASHVPYYVNTFSRLDPLIFGTVIAFVFCKLPKVVSYVQKYSWLVFVLSMAILLWGGTHSAIFIMEHKPFALTAFDFGWMLFAVSVLTFKPLVWVFSSRYVASFGRLTYGMYVVHAMVIQLIVNRIVKPLGYPENSNECAGFSLFLGLPLTFGLAWLLWHAYEKHFYKLKSKFAPVKSGFMANS